MKWKKFLQQFGGIFGGAFILSFFLLVTFFAKLHFQPIWGDVLIVRENITIYLPFGTAVMVAIFITALVEGYKLTRH